VPSVEASDDAPGGEGQEPDKSREGPVALRLCDEADGEVEEEDGKRDRDQQAVPPPIARGAHAGLLHASVAPSAARMRTGPTRASWVPMSPRGPERVVVPALALALGDRHVPAREPEVTEQVADGGPSFLLVPEDDGGDREEEEDKAGGHAEQRTAPGGWGEEPQEERPGRARRMVYLQSAPAPSAAPNAAQPQGRRSMMATQAAHAAMAQQAR
jgi:hypothetical protein